MKRAVLASIFLLGLAADARADIAVAPRGWIHDEAGSEQLTAKAATRAQPGVSRATVVVQAWRSPDSQGSVWFTRTEVGAPEAQRNAIATSQLRELTETARRQGTAQIETSAQRWDAAGRLLESTITWRDPTLGLREIGRTMVTADADRIVSITGECVFAITAPPEIEKTCAVSLGTLASTIAPKDRVELAIVDAPPAETAPAADPVAASPSEPSAMAPSRPGDAARLDAGPRGPLMTISPAEREPDRRPIYLGAGIVLLALVFWWNRRQRDRFDREDKPRSRDDDADDLHAAARGDAPKDES